MNGISFVLQIIIASVLIFFISGRLIGSNINLMKRILSVLISVSFTTFVFWYTYLRDTNFTEESVVSTVVSVATLLWLGSMLLISMLLYLFFELFDPIELNENGDRRTAKGSLIKKLISYWRRQKRLRTVVSIAMKNGITRTVKYARYRDDERELAIALRDTLEQCGGIFVKFGQVLSTRKELFSPVFIDELEQLQQNVRPLSKETVSTLLKNNLSADIDQYFFIF